MHSLPTAKACQRSNFGSTKLVSFSFTAVEHMLGHMLVYNCPSVLGPKCFEHAFWGPKPCKSSLHMRQNTFDVQSLITCDRAT